MELSKEAQAFLELWKHLERDHDILRFTLELMSPDEMARMDKLIHERKDDSKQLSRRSFLVKWGGLDGPV